MKLTKEQEALLKKQLDKAENEERIRNEIEALEQEWQLGWQSLQECEDPSEGKALMTHCNRVQGRIILLKKELYGL